MNRKRKLSKKQKYFAFIFIIGILVKYNYLLLRIFYVPSILGVILRNMVIMTIFVYFLYPLAGSRRGRSFLFLFSLIFTVVFMANYWYNIYYGNYLTVSDIIMGQGIDDFSIIDVVIRHILRFYDFVFILDLPLLLYFLSAKKTSRRTRVFGWKKKKSRVFPIIIVLFLLSIQILSTNFLLGNNTPQELFRDTVPGFVNVYGVTPLYVADVYNNIFTERTNAVKPEIPEVVMKNELDDRRIVDKDTNIIVIQLESYDKKLLNYKHNGKEISPFINGLRNKSLSYTNFYAHHINGSFDADFSFITSLYPINGNYAFKQNDMSQFDSLVRTLNEEGYNTMAFHGNDKEFFYRHKAYPELGFDKFYGKEDFSLIDRKMDVEVSQLGINDYDFFKQSAGFIEQAAGESEPFLAYLITVTSHTPFDFYPPDQTQEKFSDIDDELVHDFFQSIYFLDKSLEMFFEELDRRGLKEDTLFVIYSDHESKIDTPEYSSSRNIIMDRNVEKPQHIPLFIKHPEIETGISEVTGSITDIGPTILDILGIKEKPEEFVGTSLFKKEEEPVLFLHENPQALYYDHLFVRTPEQFEKIGYIAEPRKKEVKITSEKKDNIMDIINFIKDILLKRIRDIEDIDIFPGSS